MVELSVPSESGYRPGPVRPWISPLLFCLLLSLPELGCRSAADRTVPDARSVELRVDQYLATYTSGSNFSGTVLLARGDSILLNKGYGFAVAEHEILNTSETRFLIGSISKSFTAAAVLMLADGGDLELDDPISTSIPDFPRGSEITIRHLLEHTSGIGRIVFHPEFADRSRRGHTPAELVSWIGTQELVSEPGERYGYSNANYAVLAYLVELASGLPYDQYIRSELLDPLRMNDTGHRERAEVIVHDLADGYVPVGVRDLQRSRLFDYSIFAGSGSMFSTTGDLFRWHRAMVAGRLPGQETGDRSDSLEVTPPPYGWSEEERLARKALVQRGWDGVGFAVQYLYVPADQVTIIVLCNLSMSSIPTEIAGGLAALLLGEEADPPLLLDQPDMTSARLAQVAGTYRFGNDFYVPGATMQVAVSNGQLIIPATALSPEGGLLPLSGGRFIHRQQWIPVSFETGADDRVAAMRYGRFTATPQAPEPATLR